MKNNYTKTLEIIKAAKGIDQKDLANILNISPSYLSKIESGKRELTPKLAKKICKELSIPKELFIALGKTSEKLSEKSNEDLNKISRLLLDIVVKN